MAAIACCSVCAASSLSLLAEVLLGCLSVAALPQPQRWLPCMQLVWSWLALAAGSYTACPTAAMLGLCDWLPALLLALSGARLLP